MLYSYMNIHVLNELTLNHYHLHKARPNSSGRQKRMLNAVVVCLSTFIKTLDNARKAYLGLLYSRKVLGILVVVWLLNL